MSMRGGHWQVGLQATAGPRLASCRPSVKGNRPNGTSERTSAQGSLPGVLQARDREEEGATWPRHTAGSGQCRGKDRSGAHARACLNSSENTATRRVHLSVWVSPECIRQPASSVSLSLSSSQVGSEPWDPTSPLCPWGAATGPAVDHTWGARAEAGQPRERSREGELASAAPFGIEILRSRAACE